jgi:hypothetical protein
MSKQRTELCEWNPDRDEPATELHSAARRWGCSRLAHWSVGRLNNWHTSARNAPLSQDSSE